MKQHTLNQWLWKWHFIAGLVALPFIILLAVTGGVYLFKDNYEAPKQEHVKQVEVTGKAATFQEQLKVATLALKKPPNAMEIPSSPNQATAFVTGRFSHKKTVYVNPYNLNVTGKISPQDSKMHVVRKLHGELLLGKFGTKIIELVASWMFVLIVTGLYVFWPDNKQGIKSFVTIRFKQGKRILFRDLHAVLGFWISIGLLITLAGGMPWTDVFGSNFKWLQRVTGTGFPKTWNGKGLQSQPANTTVSLDEVVALAKAKTLKGITSIALPRGPKGVYTIYNETFDLDAQERFYLDQYSGKQLFKHNWKDVGVLMRGRMWFMAFHQGQFGLWNWLLMLCIASLLAVVTIAALVSYLKRKPKGQWGTPKVPAQFKVGYGVLVTIAILGIVLPLFGISVLVLVMVDYLKPKLKI
jgi:uncharacterized iron-regulated membrane protein